MKFIILLFTVLLQRQSKQSGYQRNRQWFARLLTPFDLQGGSRQMAIAVFLLLVLLPGIILAGVLAQFSGVLGGAIGLVLQVVIFLYILGRDDFSTRFEEYKTCWQREDYQGAYHCAQQFLRVEDQDQKSPFELHKSVQQAIVYAWFVRFFIFVFWFLLAGIGGAFSCMLAYWFYRETKLDWVKSVLGALEWLPARLLALSIALAGDFVKSFPSVLRFAKDFSSDSKLVLMDTVFQANQYNEESFDCQGAQLALDEVNQLMLRCAIIWLLVVACLTVFTGFN